MMSVSLACRLSVTRLGRLPSGLTLSSARFLSGGRREERLGESSVFLQSGYRITELPVVVRKVRDVWDLYNKMGLDSPDELPEDQYSQLLPQQLNEEERELISGFNRCFNSNSIFKLLETIPVNEVTPSVAASAYRKIVELEAKYESESLVPKGRADQPQSFFRSAFITRLLDIICRGKNPAAILEGLAAAMRDGHSEEQERIKEKLVEELLVCVGDGVFELEDICKAVHVLSVFYPDLQRCRDLADKLWFGILDKSKDISPDQIVSLFSTLPHLGKSRKMILSVLESKAMDSWQLFKTGDIVQILRVLQNLQYDRVRPVFMKMVTNWLAVNIHTVSEREMLAIVYSFLQLEYVDSSIILALEKIMKLRGCKIQEHDLICTISSYCQALRLRSPVILEGLGQYFIQSHRTLTVPQVSALAPVFGHLDFTPPNGFKFWELLEFYLETNFSQFTPVDIINLLVSFIYIEKWPINFTRKLFNPYFLDRLHSQPEELVAISRQQLKLYDTSMKLECRGYEGPFLPKETHARSIPSDSRVLRTCKKLVGPLGEVVGDVRRISQNVILSSLPLHPLYIVDLMIYPSHAASLSRFGFQTNNTSNVAVLVNTPEHYDRSGEHLVGSQALRVRQLQVMGFKVMNVNMTKVNKLAMHPNKLKDYLQRLYQQAKVVKTNL